MKEIFPSKSYDKIPHTNGKFKKQSDNVNSNAQPKYSITKRSRVDLGRSIWVRNLKQPNLFG